MTIKLLKSIMNLFNSNLPYRKRNFVEIGYNDPRDRKDDHAVSPWDYQSNDGRLINFDYILKTGRIPFFGNPYEKSATPRQDQQYTVDWNKNDAYNQARKIMENQISYEIESNREMQTLLKKEQWTKEDRETWEEKLSVLVAKNTNSLFVGLGNYRTTAYAGYTGEVAKSAPLHLNKISTDIESGTHNVAYDCISQSVLKGAIMQRIEQKYLPAAHDGSYKSAQNYFLAIGKHYTFYSTSDRKGYGTHAYIVSSATGNVTEGTVDPYGHPDVKPQDFMVYFRHSDRNYSFKDFIEGTPFIADNHGSLSIYRNLSKDSQSDLVAYVNKYGDLPGIERIGSLLKYASSASDYIPSELLEIFKLRDKIKKMQETEPQYQNPFEKAALKTLQGEYKVRLLETCQSKSANESLCYVSELAKKLSGNHILWGLEDHPLSGKEIWDRIARLDSNVLEYTSMGIDKLIDGTLKPDPNMPPEVQIMVDLQIKMKELGKRIDSAKSDTERECLEKKFAQLGNKYWEQFNEMIKNGGIYKITEYLKQKYQEPQPEADQKQAAANPSSSAAPTSPPPQNSASNVPAGAATIMP